MSRRRLASEIKANVKIRKVESSVAGTSTIRRVSAQVDTTSTIYHQPPPSIPDEFILGTVPLPPKTERDNADGVEREEVNKDADNDDDPATWTRVSCSAIPWYVVLIISMLIRRGKR